MNLKISRWQIAKIQYKRGLLRAFYRLLFHVAYFFSPGWAFNFIFLTLPEELIPEILRKFGASIGCDTTIMHPLHVHNMGKTKSDHFSNLIIGDYCYLGPELFIDLQEQIVIEDRATISMRVSLITHIHVGQSPLGDYHFPAKKKPIIIRQGAYIGASSILLMGVEVGECSAIGAGSVVTQNVPAHSVVAGAPARFIRKLE
jgi:acetyltransferase-like isoleucine patch superfamily enzyme